LRYLLLSSLAHFRACSCRVLAARQVKLILSPMQRAKPKRARERQAEVCRIAL
jgi:hypothetical protein